MTLRVRDLDALRMDKERDANDLFPEALLMARALAVAITALHEIAPGWCSDACFPSEPCDSCIARRALDTVIGGDA